MAKYTEIDDELEEAVAKKKAEPVTIEAKVEKKEPEAKKTAAVVDDVEDTPAPTTKATATSTKKTAASDDDGDSDDVEWGDEKIMSRSGGLDRLRPEKGKAVRFAIIPWIKPKKALTHFIDKKGTFRCLATEDEPGICCKKLAEDGSVTIAALVLHYTNAPSNDGKYRKDANGRVPAIEWRIEYVQLGQTNYRDISELPPEGSSVTDIDIVMTHKGGDGIGYKFTLASTAARWRQNEALVAEVKEACEKFMDGKKLSSKLGKKVNLTEMKAVLSTLVAGAEDQSLDDVEEI
jgi:hypothetical protein